MKKRRLLLAFIFFSLALAALAAETAARLFWRDAPRDVRPFNTLEFQRIPDEPAAFIMKPDSAFFFKGVSARTNKFGLRGPEPAVPKPAGTVRIVTIGDETVFGPGLSDADTLPRRLQATLKNLSSGKNVEVINAGIPWYNFQRSAGLVEPLVRMLRPDLVLIVISENDFDIQSLSPLGRLPSIAAEPPSRPHGRLPFLGNILLPSNKIAPLRYFIARISRAYLFSACFLKGYLYSPDNPGPPLPDNYNPNIGLRRLNLAQSSACQARRLVWSPLEHSLRDIQRLQQDFGFQFATVLFSDFRLRGRAALKILETFDNNGALLLNLSAYRKSEIYELRNHSLRWDPWPNASSNSRDARLIASFLTDTALLPAQDSWKKISTRERPYDELLRIRKSMYWDKVNEQEISDAAAAKDFSSSIDFSAPSSFRPHQLLYGWWPIDRTAWLGFPDTAWISNGASVRLSVPPAVSLLHLEGRLFKPALAAIGPAEFGATFECLPSNTIYRSSGDTFEFDFPVPEELKDYKILEASISSYSLFTPSDLGLREEDDGLISIGITKIELK